MFIFFSFLFSCSNPVDDSIKNQDHNQSFGPNTRIETEYKLSTPDSLIDQVYKYLNETYAEKNIFLNNIDTACNAVFSDEKFSDIYFDNYQFQLVKNENGIRYRIRKVLSDPLNRKNNRELIQVKISGTSKNDLTREEYKYHVEHSENETENNYSILGLVEVHKRVEVSEKLKKIGVQIASLHPFIKIGQERKRICFNKDGITVFGISLDHVTAQYKKHTTHFTEIEIEVNEIAYTNADSLYRTEMERTIEKIKKDILVHFETIKQDQTPKYNKGYNKLKQEYPNFDTEFLRESQCSNTLF